MKRDLFDVGDDGVLEVDGGEGRSGREREGREEEDRWTCPIRLDELAHEGVLLWPKICFDEEVRGLEERDEPLSDDGGDVLVAFWDGFVERRRKGDGEPLDGERCVS